MVLLLLVELNAGVVHVGDEVEIVGIKDETSKVVVTGVEMFRKLLDYAEAGDNIGAFFVVCTERYRTWTGSC